MTNQQPRLQKLWPVRFGIGTFEALNPLVNVNGLKSSYDNRKGPIAIDLSEGPDDTPVGPFRLEYVLFSEFETFRETLKGIDPERGHSNLKLSENLTRLDKIVIEYQVPSLGVTRKAELKLVATGGSGRNTFND